MNIFFGLIASSIVGSIVFTILLILRPVTNKVFSKAWHYYSLLVPLAFLLGATHISVSVSNLIPDTAQVSTPLSGEPQLLPVGIPLEPINPPLFDGFMINVPTNYSEALWSADSVPVASQLVAYLEVVAPFLFTLWGLGAILFILISAKRYLEYRHKTLYGAKRITDLECKIPIVVSMSAHTPMLIGVLRPTIVLPNMHFEDDELHMVLSHEMLHYKRKDLFIKLLMLVANALHWFNPAVYALNEHLNAACELSCDEKVVSKMDAKNRVFYGNTIIKVLQHSIEHNNEIKNVAFATNLCSSKKRFKRRLVSMMNTKKMKKSVVALALATGLLVVGSGVAVSGLVDAAMPIVSVSASEPVQVVIPEPNTAAQDNASQGTARVVSQELDTSQSMLLWPVEGHTRVTSMFGMMTNPLTGREEFHTGIDIPAPEGAPVLAAKDGYVAQITKIHSLFDEEWSETTIIIKHGNDEHYTTLYDHLSAIHVVEGQFVQRGEHIADVGSFGVTGPHLHFELRINGRSVDPLPFFGLAFDDLIEGARRLTLRDLEMQSEVYDWTDNSRQYDLTSSLHMIEHMERGISFALSHIYFEDHAGLPPVPFDTAAIIAADAIYAEFGICIDGLSGHMLFVDNTYMQVQFWSGFIRCEESTTHSFGDELFHFVIDAVTGEILSLYMNTVETPFHG